MTAAAAPFYPPQLRLLNYEGTVRLRVSTDGLHASSIDRESGQSMLARAAAENVRTWRFQAHKPTTFRVTFTYKLLPEVECTMDSGVVTLRLPLEVEISAKRVKTCDPWGR